MSNFGIYYIRLPSMPCADHKFVSISLVYRLIQIPKRATVSKHSAERSTQAWYIAMCQLCHNSPRLKWIHKMLFMIWLTRIGVFLHTRAFSLTLNSLNFTSTLMEQAALYCNLVYFPYGSISFFSDLFLSSTLISLIIMVSFLCQWTVFVAWQAECPALPYVSWSQGYWYFISALMEFRYREAIDKHNGSVLRLVLRAVMDLCSSLHVTCSHLVMRQPGQLCFSLQMRKQS